eukprot:3217409-Pleurochrysis_carterae.AAC.1
MGAKVKSRHAAIVRKLVTCANVGPRHLEIQVAPSSMESAAAQFKLWKPGHKLGEGTFGEVHVAKHERTGERQLHQGVATQMAAPAMHV